MMATTFNKFGDIANALPDVLSQIVRKTVFDGQANIQARIQANGQVDTGFLLNSVYTVTSEGSSYGQGGDPPKGAERLPEVEASPDQTTAYIAVGADYAAYQNYGTRFQPARPFWEPGIEDTRPGFEAALSAVEAKLKEATGL